MDSDPNCNVGRADLSGKSDSVRASRETAPIPAVSRPGAGPSSAMVTRSRARGGRSKSVEPEVEYRSEGEFPHKVEIPAETDEGGWETARPTTDTASQYKPEVATSQEVTTSASITTQTPLRTSTIPHTGSHTGMIHSELVMMCQQIHTTGKWPNDFLQTVVIPLEKKENATDCRDFRTISPL